jgi:adenylate kinase family enzyme
MNLFPYKRIVVIGTTSSGKSTLAKALSERLGFDFIELDALHWEPNWKMAEIQVFRERAREATQSAGWVVAGNYSKVRDVIWSRAEAVIWLDYPLPIVFWRLLLRTIRRGWTQEELWNGNRETFWEHLKLWSEGSLFRWLFKTYWRRKEEIPILLSFPEFEHLALIHFKNPRETEQWLTNLPAATKAVAKENQWKSQPPPAG